MSNNQEQNSKKNTKKRNFGFLYLFIFVFIIALAAASHFVKEYSPDVDVTIGNRERAALNYADSDYEIKTIDERLKWIQMEDDMPSVSVKKEKINDYSYLFQNKPAKTAKSNDVNARKSGTESEQKLKKHEAPRPSADAIKTKLNIPLPLNEKISSISKSDEKDETAISITKVYLGSYSSIDEAIDVQHRLSDSGLGLSPFVKLVNDKYIVQAASFYESQRADDLISRLKEKGFPAKKKVEK